MRAPLELPHKQKIVTFAYPWMISDVYVTCTQKATQNKSHVYFALMQYRNQAGAGACTSSLLSGKRRRTHKLIFVVYLIKCRLAWFPNCNCPSAANVSTHTLAEHTPSDTANIKYVDVIIRSWAMERANLLQNSLQYWVKCRLGFLRAQERKHS